MGSRARALAACAALTLAAFAAPAASQAQAPRGGDLLDAGASKPPTTVQQVPLPHGPTPRRAFVARILRPTRALAAPRAGAATRARLERAARWGGGSNRLLITDSRQDDDGVQWLQVLLPVRPNATRGWIAADDADVTPTPWRLSLSLRTRRLRVLRSGRTVRTMRAVIGAPATPTPTGSFAVSEVIAQRPAHGFLGPWALHLTAFSDVLDDFGGGPGRVAIHGRDGASLRDRLGSARSHGCVRITDRDVRWLAARIGAGVPVDIRR